MLLEARGAHRPDRPILVAEQRLVARNLRLVDGAVVFLVDGVLERDGLGAQVRVVHLGQQNVSLQSLPLHLGLLVVFGGLFRVEGGFGLELAVGGLIEDLVAFLLDGSGVGGE
mmetsp:Transcript_20241/g.19180  ORF Transcript_20241/g.19180 Transcript_20241/m.19180 type:complete len:113 (+) Transcript_20241:265-603(+)